MANPSKTDNSNNSNSSDPDWQKGVPYAKADPWTGPPQATVRKSILRRNADGTVTELMGGLQDAQSHPISAEDFNAMAKGGRVRAKAGRYPRPTKW